MIKDSDHLPIYPFVLFAGRFSFDSGQASGPRICYANSLFLIEEGLGKLTLNDQEYEMIPGMLFYLPAGERHHLEADINRPMVQRYAYFDWQYMDRDQLIQQGDYIRYEGQTIVEEFISPAYTTPLAVQSTVDKLGVWLHLFDQVTSIPHNLLDNQFPEILKIQGHFQILLYHFISLAVRLTTYIDPRIRQIIERIEEEQEQGDSGFDNVEQWADELGLSRSYFHALFKETTGFTPKMFWNQYRISKAKDALKGTSLSITDIAEQLNYSSIHYFSKVFRKATGLSPSAYRRTNLIY